MKKCSLHISFIRLTKGMSFTGFWKLNHVKTSTQKSLLRAMGRPSWQISVIDGADEDFRLIHYTKTLPTGAKVHLFDKKVKIFLNSKFLSALSFFIPINQVNYSHKLVANGNVQKHSDDQKQFGPSSSKTLWTSEDDDKTSTGTFTIRWYLSKGLLKVTHTVTDNDEFKLFLSFTNHKGETFEAYKVYDRHPLVGEHAEYIKNSKEFSNVNGFH
jgi:hypothetical protein